MSRHEDLAGGLTMAAVKTLACANFAPVAGAKPATLDETVPVPASDTVAKLAAEFDRYVVFGLAERDETMRGASTARQQSSDRTA